MAVVGVPQGDGSLPSSVPGHRILFVEEARAEAIRLINESAPGQGYLTLKSLEAFETAADGKATKLIIPSDLQGIAGLAASAKEILSDK